MMNPIRSIAMAALLVAASAAASAAKPDVIAHRGGALVWPENTLYAFEQAARSGVEYLEMDLQMTADNVLLVTHDEAINTSMCSVPEGLGLIPKHIRALTLEQSRHFECGTRSRGIYPDAEKRPAGMPTLEEVFERFGKDTKVRYFIETKMPKPDHPGKPIDTTLYAAKLDQLIRRYGLEDRVILQSFDWRTLTAMHELNPRVRTCPLAVPRNSHDYSATLRELHATCVVLDPGTTTPAQVKQLQDEGVYVISGVIDTPEKWQEATDFGYDAVFTNDPVGVIRFLDGKAGKGR